MIMVNFSIDDLMKYTYEGRYADDFMKMFPIGFGKPALGLAGGQGGPTSAQMHSGDLLKADDPFLVSKTNYFNPIFGMTTMDWLNHEADLFKLLRKETYAQKGDSGRVITAAAVNFRGQLETAAALGETDIPTVEKFTYDDPAVMYSHWSSSMIAQMKSTWQDTPKKNAAAFFKEYMGIQHASDLNAKLMVETGTLAKIGGDYDNFIESVDRVCSDGAEEALLDAGDCDIHGWDRSANEAEAYNDINGGTLRNLSLGLIDDMVADIKKYSRSKNFIMVTDDTQLNNMEALEGVKLRYAPSDKWKVDAQSGVNTRKGAKIGFAVSSYVAAGIDIPIFITKDCHFESGGSGNIYCLDMDHIAIRMALPTVYFDTENVHFLLLDNFNYKYMYLTVAQLVADQFNCHGAIKYLN